MRFQVSVQAGQEGEYVATCDQLEAQGRGLSVTAALDRLRDEIRYRVELCPCSGIDEDLIDLEIS
ncbi:MAG: hypothetical protein V3U29_00570 [Phycisphaeraceae bacterium]